MGALTNNRKRCFIDLCLPFSPHPSLDLSPLTPPSKKPKLQSPPSNSDRTAFPPLSTFPPPAPLRRPVHGPQRILKAFRLRSAGSIRRTPPEWVFRKEAASRMGNFVSRFFEVKEHRPVDGSHEGLGLEEYKKLVGHSAAVSDVRAFSSAVSDLTIFTRKVEEPSDSYVLNKKVDDAIEDLHELFPPLTDEEEDEVFYAMQGGSSHEVLVTHEASSIEIKREVLQCLSSGVWLNDEVINVYLELLKERERREPKRFLKCHFFNTFFYKKLISGRNGYDFKAIRRWTTQKKLGYGLIECDKIFVPIHKDIHWCLAVINVEDETFQYLDSLGGMDTAVLRVLARYFMDEVKDKSNKQIDTSSWKLEIVDDLPQQKNGWDCGMFMIKYADFYSRGLNLCFSQEHMEYFRKRTAKEILRLRAE